MYSEPKAFALFAYELRVFDAKMAKKSNKPDYYTKKILDLRVITSPIWETILYSNHYNDPAPAGEIMSRMIVDDKVLFRLNLGVNTFRCEDKSFLKDEAGAVEKPLIVSYPDETLV